MAKPWLVTWSTYGAWLPGDPRGFQTWRAREYVPPPARYAKPGEPTYNPNDYRETWEMAKELCPHAVYLTRAEQEIVLASLVDEINQLPLAPVILSVGTWHNHLIAEFGSLLIRPTVGRLKARATRDIPNPGNRKRIWADGCHMKSLPTDDALQQAFAYVRRHKDEGALIYEWSTP
jgi:hypothetical protein